MITFATVSVLNGWSPDEIIDCVFDISMALSEQLQALSYDPNWQEKLSRSDIRTLEKHVRRYNELSNYGAW